MSRGNPIAESLLSGGLAGVTALITTYPLDLIRARLTIQTSEQKYNGIVDTFKKVVREEGYRALYKGVGTSCLVSSLAHFGPFSDALLGYCTIRSY